MPHDDMTHATVVLDGDVDQMGVVVYDGGGERVKVWFGGTLTNRHWQDGAEYIDRSRLEDVTDEDEPGYNLAVSWGLIDNEEDED